MHASLPLSTVESLDKRYAPYADWREELIPAAFDREFVPTYWQSRDEIRLNHSSAELPLQGLHVALDPGHVGGDWAKVEGRNFKIDANDFLVREGELMLEVAQMIRTQLQDCGAQVSLLRETARPVNFKSPLDYLQQAQSEVPPPKDYTIQALFNYGQALQRHAQQLATIRGELLARAKLVNEVIQPDLLISLHMNAAVWPKANDGAELYQLVASNHLHVLILGCASTKEFSDKSQQRALATKIINRSGEEEWQLAQVLARGLAKETTLPPASYDGRNAIKVEASNSYVWARTLLLLRMVEGPVIMLEPYVANSRETYPRIQAALARRVADIPLAADDILAEYSNAVVQALLTHYRSPSSSVDTALEVPNDMQLPPGVSR